MSDTLSYIPPLENLAAEFRKLPGIGRKSSYRLAFAVLDFSEAEAQAFSQAILAAKQKVMRCKICQNISDTEICPICADRKRKQNLICVVEDPRDVAAIAKLGEYDGVFHVLGGLISPLEGKTPDKLAIKELLSRVNALLADQSETNGEPPEIILATNPSVEGDATAMYLARLIKPLGAKVTRLAYGIPVGGDLEYADEITLGRALAGRRAV